MASTQAAAWRIDFIDLEHSICTMTIKDNEVVDLDTPKGPMRTYVFRPTAGGRYPGIILWSEIFQVTAPIRRTAAMLAGHGFVVAAPEIWHEIEPIGCQLAYDQAGADKGNADKTLKAISSFDDDTTVLVEFLKSHAACTGRIGTLGICIGGHLATRAAFHPDVKAAVCLYPTDIHKGNLGSEGRDGTLGRFGDISGEMVYVFGRQDPHVPREGRRVIYEALSDAGVNFTWHEFNGQHAFMRDEGHRYDPELALKVYGLALELFKRRLHEGDLPVAATGPGESRH